jgi:hypothetical protein
VCAEYERVQSSRMYRWEECRIVWRERSEELSKRKKVREGGMGAQRPPIAPILHLFSGRVFSTEL